MTPAFSCDVFIAKEVRAAVERAPVDRWHRRALKARFRGDTTAHLAEATSASKEENGVNRRPAGPVVFVALPRIPLWYPGEERRCWPARR